MLAGLLASPLGTMSQPGEAAAGSGHFRAEHESWDNGMNMCMPAAGAAAAPLVISGQLNAFGVVSDAQGPRGSSNFAAPNMFMVDAGRQLGSRQFLNLDVMGTTERWTYPQHGYPELLQIGEERSDGSPFVDAQHPHSSPVMGLTLSDTISLGSSNTLKVFMAPRGESTDGPVAFMHRDTARDNPDAPLGHHVGQDVGHISSSVLGTQLTLGRLTFEASAFNGTEPLPTKVDLPIGAPNSEALRVTYELTPGHRVMASWAHVEQQDPQYPGTTSATRLSASVYDHVTQGDAATGDHTFIVGSITRHPAGATSTSFLDEAVWRRGSSDFWGRVEVLQRLRSELAIPASTQDAIREERWVSALTVGYTHWSAPVDALRVGLGTSLTMDALPEAWAASYGGRNPLTLRVIVQIRGSGRWQR